MPELLVLPLMLFLTIGLSGKKNLEMTLTSFLVFARREGSSEALLIVTRVGFLIDLLDVEGTTLGVSLAKNFSLSDLDQLLV